MASPLLTLTVTLGVLILLESAHGYSEYGGDWYGGDSGDSYGGSYDAHGHDEGYDDYVHEGHMEGDSHGSRPKPAPPRPPPKTRVLFLDLVLTLDGSSGTGASAFSKSQQFIIMMLKTYILGGNSLRLKVVYSNGANIQIFTFDNDAQTQTYVNQINGCRYSGSALNIQLIFQKITSFYLSFQRAGAGRCLFMMGGFNVGNSWEIKARIALYVQTISINFRFYYFAIGSQTGLTFWQDIVDRTYIIQLSSFSVTSSWTISWFQTNTANFKIYGLWRTMKKINLQLVLTLDASSTTGKDGYYETFYMILTLLRTHSLGSGNLQLYVCVHRGGQVNVVQFKSQSDISANLNLLSTTYWSFTSVSVNVVLVLQKVQWVVQNSFSSYQPKSIWLCGGMQVSSQQRQVQLIIYQLETTMKTYFYYFAIGVQRSTSFWTQALGSRFVKTDFTVSVTTFNSILVNVAATASNLQGPTVTSVIMEVGRPTTIAPYVSGGGSGHYEGESSSSHDSHYGGHDDESEEYHGAHSSGGHYIGESDESHGSHSGSSGGSSGSYGGSSGSNGGSSSSSGGGSSGSWQGSFGSGGSSSGSSSTGGSTGTGSWQGSFGSGGSSSGSSSTGGSTGTGSWQGSFGSGGGSSGSSSTGGSTGTGSWQGSFGSGGGSSGSSSTGGSTGTGSWQGSFGSGGSSSGSSSTGGSTGTGSWQGSSGGSSGLTGSSMSNGGGFSSSSSTSTTSTNMSARIVNGVTQIPQAFNVKGTGCAGMSGTTDVGGGYCAITNMDAFITWAQSVGWKVERTYMNGIQTIKITGSVTYAGKK
ncbi:uncharacterized protein LOC135497960 [Lineus longissimus]|uniref:uncharacterized protein LOC135497960 n=1 Tax=Lineus longissimus TaxID=88925 RepID=UPI00315DCD3D